MSYRRLQVADLRDFSTAVATGSRLITRINEESGSGFRMSIPVGSNAGAIGVAAAWETPAAYEAFLGAMRADEGLSSAVGVVSSLMSSVEDDLLQVIAPPGEPAAYTTITAARMSMPRVAEAVPFALGVADLVRNKIDRQIGVGSAITGDRSRILWVGYNDDLTGVFADRELLEGDPEYVELFKQSEGLFQDGSLEASIWQRVA